MVRELCRGTEAAGSSRDNACAALARHHPLSPARGSARGIAQRTSRRLDGDLKARTRIRRHGHRVHPACRAFAQHYGRAFVVTFNRAPDQPQVVAKDLAPYTMVGGVPARVIRDRFEPETVQALQASAWWEMAPEDRTRCDARSPDLFAAQVLRGREHGQFQPLETQPLTAGVISEHLDASAAAG